MLCQAFSEVYLEFDVKLIDHSLPNSGSWTYSHGGTGEWPADARIYFTDTEGIDYLWNHGFLSLTDYYNRTNYTVVSKGSWYHYRAPYLINDEKTNIIFYDTPESITLKCNYALQQKLRGVMIWALGGDYVNDEQPLLKAIGKAVKKTGN